MDLSGLIFVALAVAWAVYLVPKALRHHEDVARARTVDRFSHTMRVLARREPVSAKAARLVVSSSRRTSAARRTPPAGATALDVDAPVAPAAPSAPSAPAAPAVSAGPGGSTAVGPVRSRRAAVRQATRRRRRVLLGLTGLLVLVVAAAGLGRIGWPLVAVPVVLLVGWLVLCRVMVRGEHARVRPAVSAHSVSADSEAPVDESAVAPVATGAEALDPLTDTSDIPVVPAVDAESDTGAARPGSGLWDPLPVTLPTYVTKPKATRRTVRTIDLEDSDVWTSGRTEVDAALAREADAERAVPVAPEKSDESQRAVGS